MLERRERGVETGSGRRLLRRRPGRRHHHRRVVVVLVVHRRHGLVVVDGRRGGRRLLAHDRVDAEPGGRLLDGQPTAAQARGHYGGSRVRSVLRLRRLHRLRRGRLLFVRGRSGRRRGGRGHLSVVQQVQAERDAGQFGGRQRRQRRHGGGRRRLRRARRRDQGRRLLLLLLRLRRRRRPYVMVRIVMMLVEHRVRVRGGRSGGGGEVVRVRVVMVVRVMMVRVMVRVRVVRVVRVPVYEEVGRAGLQPLVPLAPAQEAAVVEHVLGHRVQRPVVALARVARFPRDLDETVVQRQVVPDRVLPRGKFVPVVREPGHDELADAAQRELLVRRLQNGHGDERDVAVRRLDGRPVAATRARRLVAAVLTAAAADAGGRRSARRLVAAVVVVVGGRGRDCRPGGHVIVVVVVVGRVHVHVRRLVRGAHAARRRHGRPDRAVGRRATATASTAHAP